MNDAVGTGVRGVDPDHGGAVRISGLHHRFTGPDGRPVEVIGQLDLVIEPGSFVCLAGPSGCGKSTLLRIIAGLIRPSSGTVTVDGHRIDGPGHDRGVVFQQPALYPWLSVADNVSFGLRLRGVPLAQRTTTASRYLDLVGLSDVADFRPYELSGGMQQRAQLARVLANDPEIVLMDEPFGALDAITRDRLQDELLGIWAETRKTVLFITHSVDEAAFLATRVLVMSSRPGRIVLDEPVEQDRQRGRSAVRATAEYQRLLDRIGVALEDRPDHE